jgi:hypothetical protein
VELLAALIGQIAGQMSDPIQSLLVMVAFLFGYQRRSWWKLAILAAGVRLLVLALMWRWNPHAVWFDLVTSWQVGSVLVLLMMFLGWYLGSLCARYSAGFWRNPTPEGFRPPPVGKARHAPRFHRSRT